MVTGKVGEIPRHGSIGLAQRIGAIDKRDIVEFGPADAFGLHDAKQSGVMQIAFGLRREAPQLLGPGGTIAQLRNQRPGAGDHGGMAIRSHRRRRTGIRCMAFSCHQCFPGRFLACSASYAFDAVEPDQCIA